ncbi:transcriptional regulator [Brachybacterium vulturis]|uniref:Transcriptional regulator n=1 Tax=Brachybacterium vulturis TaxID=2017484 RepID=A0A291GJW0_9MICO|nr:helix-turn-helix domain-containing protein [Brachybacterium vulturis]ATG50350.1 transcriptional regulator [Brachybacterium vulturis]
MVPHPDPSLPDSRARLEALEARVAALESAGTTEEHLESGRCAPSRPPRPDAAASAAASTPVQSSSEPAEDAFWALTSLKEHCPTPGAVVFAGAVDVGAGHLEYQWGRPTEHLLATDWAEHAETVAALGHPLRLALLRRLLDGEHTVAQLVDELELASTGVAYHHLSALQGGGWVTTPRRGSWALAAPRVVPLLAIITALETG